MMKLLHSVTKHQMANDGAKKVKIIIRLISWCFPLRCLFFGDFVTECRCLSGRRGIIRYTGHVASFIYKVVFKRFKVLKTTAKYFTVLVKRLMFIKLMKVMNGKSRTLSSSCTLGADPPYSRVKTVTIEASKCVGKTRQISRHSCSRTMSFQQNEACTVLVIYIYIKYYIVFADWCEHWFLRIKYGQFKHRHVRFPRRTNIMSLNNPMMNWWRR